MMVEASGWCSEMAYAYLFLFFFLVNLFAKTSCSVVFISSSL